MHVANKRETAANNHKKALFKGIMRNIRGKNVRSFCEIEKKCLRINAYNRETFSKRTFFAMLCEFALRSFKDAIAKLVKVYFY